MPVPTSIADLSTTAASNSPAGADAIGTSLDDYLRTIQAIIKRENSKGSDITASTTIDIPNDGSYFVVTGNTTIASISDDWNGRTVVLKFSGTPQLTHSSGFILPSSANITVVAGDCLVAVNESTGVWRVAAYQRASGSSVLGGLVSADIGVTVQAYDANTAKLNATQTFTASQRGTLTTDNDLNFDLSATNYFSCTPSAGGTLTFTNIPTGQPVAIKLVNGSNYAIAAHANTKISTADLTKISVTGTYLITGLSDGTNVYLQASANLA